MSKITSTNKLNLNQINIPNILTITRILTVPLVVYFVINKFFFFGFIFFILSALTDMLDGFLARRLDQATKLGAMLDPVADKLLLISLYISFYIIKEPVVEPVPIWFLGLIVFKEFFLLTGAFIVCYLKPLIPIKPTYLAKLLMVLQSLFIGFLFIETLTRFFRIRFLDKIYLNLNLLYWAYILIASLTFISLLQYTLIGYQGLKNNS